MKDIPPLHSRETVYLPRDFPAFHSAPGETDTVLASALESLSVSPICAYRWECHPGWELEPRVVGDSMWFYIWNGSGSGFIQDEEFDFGPRTMIFVPQGWKHGLKLKPRTSMKMATVHFHAQIFGSLSFFESIRFPLLMRDPGGRPFANASQYLARLHARKPPACEVAMSAIITSVLLSAVHSHLTSLSLQTLKLSEAGWSRLLPALVWFERQLHNPDASVAEAARHAGVSAEHLRKLFKKLLQMPPRQHLLQRRLGKACALLRGTERTIADICFACGFNDVPYFYRVFGQHYQCTPKGYRIRRP